MGAKITIEQMHALAKKRGGKCLSTVYVNSYTKLQWRCSEGHEWETTPNQVKNYDHWCPECARANRTLTIEQMQALAQQRNGVCLSIRYVNNQTKLRWRCSEGHEWEAVPNSVKIGTWCPRCSQGNTERIVRDVCEQLFGTQFPKARPKWLSNSRGNQMELDG